MGDRLYRTVMILKMEKTNRELRDLVTWARRSGGGWVPENRYGVETANEAEALADHLDRHLAAVYHGWGYVDNRMKNYGGI